MKRILRYVADHPLETLFWVVVIAMIIVVSAEAQERGPTPAPHEYMAPKEKGRTRVYKNADLTAEPAPAEPSAQEEKPAPSARKDESAVQTPAGSAETYAWTPTRRCRRPYIRRASDGRPGLLTREEVELFAKSGQFSGFLNGLKKHLGFWDEHVALVSIVFRGASQEPKLMDVIVEVGSVVHRMMSDRGSAKVPYLVAEAPEEAWVVDISGGQFLVVFKKCGNAAFGRDGELKFSLNSLPPPPVEVKTKEGPVEEPVEDTDTALVWSPSRSPEAETQQPAPEIEKPQKFTQGDFDRFCEPASRATKTEKRGGHWWKWPVIIGGGILAGYLIYKAVDDDGGSGLDPVVIIDDRVPPPHG